MPVIATWNVNSVKARLENVLAWLAEASPDIACFQELKCEDAAFPREAFEAAGYNVATHGQKTYNGVAILSKRPFDEVRAGLPGADGDVQSRYLEALIGGIRVAYPSRVRHHATTHSPRLRALCPLPRQMGQARGQSHRGTVPTRCL